MHNHTNQLIKLNRFLKIYLYYISLKVELAVNKLIDLFLFDGWRLMQQNIFKETGVWFVILFLLP